MATEKVLKGKLQIIVDDLSELSGSNSIKSAMITAAGYSSYVANEETEVIQYVDGVYNVTYAYYDDVEIPT